MDHWSQVQGKVWLLSLREAALLNGEQVLRRAKKNIILVFFQQLQNMHEKHTQKCNIILKIDTQKSINDIKHHELPSYAC